MTTDINNFVTIKRQKNGVSKIIHNRENEVNIYKFLRENLGFYKLTTNKKRDYYRRGNNKPTPVSMFHIRDAFRDFIKHEYYTNLPEDIAPDEIYEWYISKNPIKENDLLRYILKGKI